MDLNLKYTAIKIDEIEQAKKQPIGNCIGDTSISNICLFLQKGLIDDNGIHGVSKNVAMDVIEKYRAEKDIQELLLDITEALCRDGFLSRKLDVKTMREALTKRTAQLNEVIKDNV